MGMWSGVPEVWPGRPCDVCGSKEQVESKQLKIITCGMKGMIETGDYRQSNLCKKCKESGWSSLHNNADFGRITYWNHKTLEFKTV